MNTLYQVQDICRYPKVTKDVTKRGIFSIEGKNEILNRSASNNSLNSVISPPLFQYCTHSFVGCCYNKNYTGYSKILR